MSSESKATNPADNAGELPIRDEMIRLGQLLKLASLAEDGAEAKTLIDNGLVQVNGEIEERRGRQLHPGDTRERQRAERADRPRPEVPASRPSAPAATFRRRAAVPDSTVSVRNSRTWASSAG
jgi:ribosome-associated protein